jgi:hypothetical protein
MPLLHAYAIISVAAFIGTVVGLAGCSTAAVSCTDNVVFALQVKIEDETTRKVICSANVTATDGTYQDTLMEFPATGGGEEDAGPNACIFSGVNDRAGTYDIMASAPGFQTSVVRGVEVPQGQCHVIPQSITVELNPM